MPSSRSFWPKTTSSCGRACARSLSGRTNCRWWVCGRGLRLLGGLGGGHPGLRSDHRLERARGGVVVLIGVLSGLALAAAARVAPRRSYTPADYGVTVRGGATPGRDRQLPVDGEHPGHPGCGAGRRRSGGAGLTPVPSMRRRRRELALMKTLGSPAVSWRPPWPGSPASLWLSARRSVSLRDHRRSDPLDPVRPRDRRRAPTRRTGRHRRPYRGGRPGTGNLVAAVPGRIAARTPTALLLRAE